MNKEVYGRGIIGVHAHKTHTALFTVIPGEVFDLKSGFYPLELSKDLLEELPKLRIVTQGITTFEEMGKLVSLKGLNTYTVGQLLTFPLWSFESLKNPF